MRHIKITIIFLLTLALAGCTGIKFTYNNLDWIVPWYVSDFIELTDDQEDQFEHEFEQLWKWHRQEELPKYVELLQEIEASVANSTISLEKLVDYQDRTRGLYQTVAIKVVTEGNDLMASLSDEQVDDIREVIHSEIEEFEEYIHDTPIEGRIKKRIRSTKKNLRKWVGKLTKKQVAILEQWAPEVESTLDDQYEYVKTSRAEFLKALKARSDKKVLLEKLSYLITNRDDLHSKDHLEKRERNLVRMRELMITLEGTLTKKQRRRLVNKIQDYKDSFDELSSNTE